MATLAEKREASRNALLEAAAASLVEAGIRGFTTNDVLRRAGLSNGALFRYFPTRQTLLVATVEFVLGRLRGDYERSVRSAAEDGLSLRDVLGILWDVMSDPDLGAVYDLYTAARTDPELREALLPAVKEHSLAIRVLATELVFGASDVPASQIEDVASVTVLAMQGAVLQGMVSDDEARGARIVGLIESLGQQLSFAPAPPVETKRARKR